MTTPKRIALYNVTTAHKIGGIERGVWELARTFRSWGYSVDIVSGNGPYNPYADSSLLTYRFIPRRYFSFLSGRLDKFLERLSFLACALPYLVFSRAGIFIVCKPYDFPAACLFRLFHPRAKLVFLSGGFDFIYVDKYMGALFNGMGAPSADNARILEKRYGRPVRVVYAGIDLESFKPSEALRARGRALIGAGKETPVLFTAARLVAWKGHELAIRALPEFPGAYYVIAGTGENRARLEEAAREAGVESRVRFLGTVTGDDVPMYLNACDAYIQPSVGYEALGLSIVEALACGIPAIGSRNGGITEIIEDGRNGYLFEKGNAHDLRDKLRLVLEHREELRKNCRASVAEKFTWEYTARELLASAGESVMHTAPPTPAKSER